MEKKHIGNGRRFLFGFILALVGLVMILERSGVLSWEIYDFLLSWKMLLVAIGAFVFAGGNRGAGIIVMSVGVFFMLPDIFDEYEKIKQFFWPAIILVVGATFMLGSRSKHFMSSNKFKKDQGGFSSDYLSNDYFDEFVVFGGREININTDNLLGGKATAIFGGSEIDLREAIISSEGCTIEITSIFGANALRVPNDWTVINRVTAIFGGFSDKRIKDPGYMPNPAKTIILKGACIFGGAEITNYDKVH